MDCCIGGYVFVDQEGEVVVYWCQICFVQLVVGFQVGCFFWYWDIVQNDFECENLIVNIQCFEYVWMDFVKFGYDVFWFQVYDVRMIWMLLFVGFGYGLQ